MPMVIPVVAGAWAMASAATVTTIMGALQFAGGFLTVIGGISGDKDALKLGSVLGLVGGVGGAIDKMATSATANAAGEAASQTANATAGNTVADAVGTQSAEQLLDQTAQSLASDGTALTGLQTGAEALPAGISDVGGITGVADQGMQLASEAAPSTAADAAKGLVAEQSGLAGDATKQALYGDAGYGEGMTGNATSTFDKGVTSAGDQKWGSLSDLFKSADSWLKENPNLAKLGGGIIKGASDYVGKRQLIDDRMQAEKSYRDWVRQRYSDSVRNLVIPSPVRAPGSDSGIIAGQRG